MTQIESGIFTTVDTSGYQLTTTTVSNEIGLVGNAYFKFDPNQTYSVKSLATSIPSSPSSGDYYIVNFDPTGTSWEGSASQYDIAYYDGSDWTFTTPTSGDTAFVIDVQEVYSFSTSWATTNNPHSYVWTTTQIGKIWTLTGVDYLDQFNYLLDLTETNFIDSDISNNKASYETKNSFVRAVQLIFAGNPNAIIRGLIIKDITTDAESTISGLTTALDALLSNDGIYYINVAGKIPLKDVQTHITKASGDTYMAERIYIAGYDLTNVIDSSYTYSSPSYTDGALKDDDGRTVVFAGNTLYTFGLFNEQDAKNIGGNWIAHYLTGLLSTLEPSQTITRKIFRLGKTVNFNGEEYFLSAPLRQSLANDFMNYVRRQNGLDFFEIGRTYSSDSSSYQRISTRRIIDAVVKDARANLMKYFGKLINNTLLNSAKRGVTTVLSDHVRRKNIANDFSVNVYTTPEDRVNGKIYANISLRPLTYVSYIYLTVKPSI